MDRFDLLNCLNHEVDTKFAVSQWSGGIGELPAESGKTRQCFDNNYHCVAALSADGCPHFPVEFRYVTMLISVFIVLIVLCADPQMAFYLMEVMSLANNGGSNSGEVLRIATQLVPQDFESTYTAFNYMAEQIYAIAENINVTQDPVSARDAFLRASTYYRGADFFLIGNWSDPRNYDLWDKALTSFNQALALFEPVAPERFTVKAHSPSVGDFEAIGVFYKASATNESRPTVVIGSGYDGSQEELYHSNVRQILARGLNVVTYEGPGQPTVRRKQGLGFIPVCHKTRPMEDSFI